MKKTLNRNVAIYIAGCVEIREDDGRRRMITLRLLTLSWLLLLGPVLGQIIRMTGRAGVNLVEAVGYVLAYAIAFLVMYLWWTYQLTGPLPGPVKCSELGGGGNGK